MYFPARTVLGRINFWQKDTLHKNQYLFLFWKIKFHNETLLEAHSVNGCWFNSDNFFKNQLRIMITIVMTKLSSYFLKFAGNMYLSYWDNLEMLLMMFWKYLDEIYCENIWMKCLWKSLDNICLWGGRGQRRSNCFLPRWKYQIGWFDAQLGQS